MYIVFTFRYSTVMLYCGCGSKHLSIHSNLRFRETLNKYEHSNGNLEYPNKLSAQIGVQHLYVALLSVLTTHYCIP